MQHKKTDLFFPGDFLHFGMGLDLALEVDVVALLDVGGVQLGTERQRHDGRIWNALQNDVTKLFFKNDATPCCW